MILAPKDLYPLADVCGMDLRVSTGLSSSHLRLTGDRTWLRHLPLNLELLMRLKIVDSIVEPMLGYTSGVLVAAEGGSLRLLIMLDHPKNLLTLLVLDGEKLPPNLQVFGKTWSRNATYRAVEPAVRAWFEAPSSSRITGWKERKNAHKRINNYLTLRAAGVKNRIDDALDAMDKGATLQEVVDRHADHQSFVDSLKTDQKVGNDDPWPDGIEGPEAMPERPAVLTADDLIGERKKKAAKKRVPRPPAILDI